MPTTGYGPSAEPSVGAGGKATETSSGIPSQDRICAVVVPQKRWPDACTVQLIGVAVFVNTWLIAASAVDGASAPAATTAATLSILRMSTAPPPETGGQCKQAPASATTGRRVSPAARRSPRWPSAGAGRGCGRG